MKYKLNNLLLITLALLALYAMAGAQPKPAITTVGWSPGEVLGTSKMTSSGLDVIGVGETAYLQGKDTANGTISSFTWSLGTVPAGSAASLTSISTDTTRLIPDKVGQYEVKLSITTDKGSASASITITAAKYVGVGGQSGLPVEFRNGQCALCHWANNDDWALTGHATFFANAIDGGAGDHYTKNCISCHVVGYNTAPTAVNDGFDDIAAELGWVFPSPLVPGNWASMVANQPRLAHLGNIQCENCHGPGSEHKGWKPAIDMSLDEAVCGRCHEDGSHHIKNTQWKESAHANVLEETSSACLRCHSGWGFVVKNDLKIPDDRPTSGAYQISCAVCHDPHRATLPSQLRTMADVTLLDNKTVIKEGGRGKLCMQCHQSRRDAESYATTASNISSHFGPHNAQADMLFSANAITYGLPVGHAGHQQVLEDACVTCHMAPTPAAGKPGNNKIGEHTFLMENEGVDNVAACQPCHGEIESFEDIPAAWDYDEDGNVESAGAEIEGLLEKLGELLPPDGPTVVFDKSTYDWTGLTDPKQIEYRKLLLKAGFNYAFVEEDRSNGFHNTAFAATLLRRSIASLTMGDLGAGQIESIADVPEDNGKQVLVTWSKFAADGSATNPILNYNVWMRVDVAGSGKIAAPAAKTFKSVETMPANAQAGSVVDMDGETWMFVKTVPAIAMDKYTIIAPTLFDSSKVAGMRWSVFKVTGHTSNTYWYATTAPDSGYSVDNLSPMAPANMRAQEGSQGVEVKWATSTEPDFKYYALYKGETASFDPGETGPIAKLTQNLYVDADVQVGKSYYYKVTAVDYSGNQSPYANANLTVTSVADRGDGGIPADFVLEQNYPNPFNPSTTISFGLPGQQHVTIRVYDLRGALVRTVAVGTFSPGYHQIVWDGRNEAGQLAGAGAYIYRLESENMTINKKMIFLK